jgi:hypothetical protein
MIRISPSSIVNGVITGVIIAVVLGVSLAAFKSWQASRTS